MPPLGDALALSFAELDDRIRHGVELASGFGSGEGEADPFRGLYVTDDQALALAASAPPPWVDRRLDELAGLLALDPLDRAVLAVCAAPEVSWRYARLFGYLHDDLTRQLASPRLVAALLAGDEIGGDAVLSRLDADAPLRRSGAVELLDEPRLALADRPLKCAEVVAAKLVAGVAPAVDGRLAELIGVPELAPGDAESIDELRRLLATAPRAVPVAIVGRDAAAALAWAVGRPVLLGRADAVVERGRLIALGLLAKVAGAVPALTRFEAVAGGARADLWGDLAHDPERVLLCVDPLHLTAVLGHGPVLQFELPPLTAPARHHAWSVHAPGAEVGDVAAKFRLSGGQIAHAAEIAAARAAARGDAGPSAPDLDYGARAVSRHGLDGLATRVEGEFGWSELVVPDRALRSLRMVSSFLRHRDRVASEWGYGTSAAAPAGMTALFAGESGTGKTMAARVVAAELRLDLFRIDLASVVSKYIGETEKQLDRIFAAAAGSNSILLFDEADALFGKRSDVQDAHDRYANVEVAYLLQRIEGYDGVVILTSNLRQNIDQAFLRRLDLVVEFPFPEEADRARLWRQLLRPPAPVGELDIDFLAARFKLSGGSIRNVSLAAALLAADDGGRITMEHVVRAIALEYDKLGRLTLEADFERFYPAVRPVAVGGG